MFKYIKYSLFICLSIYGLSFAESPLQSRRFFNNNGGLINHLSPLLIPDNSASGIENVSLDNRGDLIKRNGYTVIQSTSALGPNTNYVLGGGYHKAASGNDFFAVVSGSDVYRIGNTFSSYSKVTGALVLSSGTTNLAQHTSFNDAEIFCNDVDTPSYVTSSGNAAYVTTGGLFGGAKTCATYGNYLLIGNTTESGTAFPNRVRWSDINTQNSYPSLNYFDIELNDGDQIVALVSYDDSVYVFKQRSIYRILITGLPGPDAFIFRPVARNIGAWAKNSVRIIPSVGIAFLAQNTAYILGDNGLTPIGDPIQRSFDNVQRSQWSQSIGGVFPKKYQYWLAVSTTGTKNTEVLVYDYVQRNWTIYDGMNLSMIEQATDSTGDNVLITGGYTGVSWKQNNGNTDNLAGVASNITASYTSGDIFADSLDLTKNFKYLYIVTAGDHNYTLTMNVTYDLGMNSESTQSITIGSTNGVYDTAVYDTDLFTSGSNTINRLELNRSAKTIKLNFTQSDQQGSFGLIGWSIVFSIEDYRQ